MYMLYKDDQFQINYRTRNVSAYLLALASGLQYLPPSTLSSIHIVEIEIKLLLQREKDELNKKEAANGTYLKWEKVDFSRIQAQTVRVEDEHSDHYPTITSVPLTALKQNFKWPNDGQVCISTALKNTSWLKATRLGAY